MPSTVRGLCLSAMLSVCVAVVLGLEAHGAELVPLAPDNAHLTRVTDTLQGTKSKTGVEFITHDDGAIRFLCAPQGGHFATKSAATNARDTVLQFIRENTQSFGVDCPAVTFRVRDEGVRKGRTYVRAQQYYGEVPVLAGQMVVGVEKAGEVTGALADALRQTDDLDTGKLPLTPRLDSTDATGLALAQMEKQHPQTDLVIADAPTLVVFAPQVLGLGGRNRLAWSVVVAGENAPHIREQLYIDAHTGETALRFSLVKTALDREIRDADNSTSDPGTLVRDEGDAPTSSANNPHTHGAAIPDADYAYDSFYDWYDWFDNAHQRDGLDDNGMPMEATVRYCLIDLDFLCPMPNAFWDDIGQRMYFGEGFAAADDVVAHELTHGFTQFTSDLFYYGQSGALNESISDIFGEFVDLANGRGTDTAVTRWQMGEDLTGYGPMRDMEHPQIYGQPDTTCHPYWETTSVDNGGVHINSGVGNRLCSLLTDGGSLGGYTISPVGQPLVADMFYVCNAYLLPRAADYVDLYAALMWVAQDAGLSTAETANVENACKAVAITPDTMCDHAPDNDDCTSPMDVTVGRYFTGYTTMATGDLLLQCDTFQLNDPRDVWFRFVPPVTDTYTVSTCGSDFDTTLAILGNNCDTLNVLSCYDDACGYWGDAAMIQRQLTAGTTYLIRLSGKEGAVGEYSLHIEPNSGYTDCQDVQLLEGFDNGIPATWTLIDNDGNDPVFEYVTDAWVAVEDFEKPGDTEACSTSFYTNAGACSDDWLITPAIQLGDTSTLQWDAMAGDAYWADGYEVRISTSGPTMAGMLANPRLFMTTGENPTWTTRSVQLFAHGYANQTVHLAFRNGSCDDWLLYVDNIRVCGDAPPIGEISVSPMYHIFSDQDVSAGPTTPVTIVIGNVGNHDLNIQSVGLTGDGADQFAIASDTGESVLGAGETRIVGVAFDPSSAGAKTANLSVESNDPVNSKVDAYLWGNGYLGPDITITPDHAPFGFQNMDAGASTAQSVVMENAAGGTLSISDVTIVGSDASHFSISADTGETSLAGGQTRTVEAVFVPTSLGSKTATLRVHSSDSDEPIVDVTLTGTCFSSVLGVTSPVWVDFGYSGAEDGSEEYPFDSLREGTDFVTVGGTVMLKNATVAEPLRVGKALRLVRGPDRTETIALPNDVTMDMISIPAGSFLMGRYAGERDSQDEESPQHQVTLTQGFWMGETEVTQAQWQAVMGTTPWSGQLYSIEHPDSPAVYVSWDDAQQFCAALSALTGKVFRLPTEAEWEYACRAGTTTRFYWGDDNGYFAIDDYAWWTENAWDQDEKYPHVSAQKLPNPFGLYDMSGNVWEWCQDWHGDYTSEDVSDPTGPTVGLHRLNRGGSWVGHGDYCRSAYRSYTFGTDRSSSLGFRVAR